MLIYIKFLATIPVMVICYQLYAYSANSLGEDRQRRCQKLGIAYMTLGITSLVARDTALAFMGLVLIMFGFRLMAKGLDRLDKKTYIDRYNGHTNGSEPKNKDKGE